MQGNNATAFMARQQTMFRLAERDAGITRKMICLSTGYSRTAIDEWARGEKSMSGPAIVAIAAMPEFPSTLLSLLFEGTNRHLADDCDAGDHDTLAGNCVEFSSTYTRARHPQSPAGVDIAPCEDRELQQVARKVRAA